MFPLSNTAKGYLLGLTAVIIFGLTLPTTRIAVAELPATFVGLGRALVAAAIAALFLKLGNAARPTRAQIGKLALASAGIIFGFPLLSAIAMKTAPAAHGGVVLGILPLATALAGVIFAGERPSRGFWICGLIGSTAVVVFSLLDGGAEIYGALVGYAMNTDATDFVLPNPERQAQCVQLALDRAGLQADQIDIVSNHATGTSSGHAQ